jgi:hypothetical protein
LIFNQLKEKTVVEHIHDLTTSHWHGESFHNEPFPFCQKYYTLVVVKGMCTNKAVLTSVVHFQACAQCFSMNTLNMKETSFPSHLFFSFIIIFNTITFANHSNAPEVSTLLGCYPQLIGSGQHISTIFRGQSMDCCPILEGGPNRLSRNVGNKQSTLRNILKNEDLIYTTAETSIHK